MLSDNCELSVKKNILVQLYFSESLPVTITRSYLWPFLIQAACRVCVTFMSFQTSCNPIILSCVSKCSELSGDEDHVEEKSADDGQSYINDR
jgi:hypothetical protein